MSSSLGAPSAAMAPSSSVCVPSVAARLRTSSFTGLSSSRRAEMKVGSGSSYCAATSVIHLQHVRAHGGYSDTRCSGQRPWASLQASWRAAL
jgi:hypothetical protein